MSNEELKVYFQNPNHKLLTFQNAKTPKGLKRGYRTAILYLSPHKLSGLGNLCPNASPSCIQSCLYSAGRGRFKQISDARLRKTQLFYRDRESFLNLLRKEIKQHVKYSLRRNLIPAVRLNGTSDFPFETTGIMQEFSAITFYDYTKSVRRALSKNLPRNYHLVYSYNDKPESQNEAMQVLANKGKVAVVYRGKLSRKFLGHKTVNGDEHDVIFLQPKGSVIMLTAKGQARKDTSGFVVNL